MYIEKGEGGGGGGDDPPLHMVALSLVVTLIIKSNVWLALLVDVGLELVKSHKNFLLWC